MHIGFAVYLHVCFNRMTHLPPLDSFIVFAPQYKSVIWGGHIIPRLKGEADSALPVGESWEVSAIAGSESHVAGGTHDGMPLSELCGLYGEALLGREVVRRHGRVFPLLVKLIDAHRDLSIQVHPNDEVARRLSGPGAKGKSEMWYVVDAREGAHIYSGLRAPLTPGEYDRRVADNTLLDVVGVYPSRRGQFYYVPAGTIHSIGAGNVIAEIQDASDLTYRLYDYGRRDDAGNLRQLHVAQGRQAIDYEHTRHIEPTALVTSQTTPGIVTSGTFTADYLKFDTEGAVIDVASDGASFQIVMAVEGEIELSLPDGTARMVLPVAHTALIPACVAACRISGRGAALRVTCPA